MMPVISSLGTPVGAGCLASTGSTRNPITLMRVTPVGDVCLMTGWALPTLDGYLRNEEFRVADVGVTGSVPVVRDAVTGLFGFRLELGRDRSGARMQARRGGFVSEAAALVEYRRLCRQRDAHVVRPRLSDTVQAVCEGWLSVREQELEPNGVWLRLAAGLGLSVCGAGAGVAVECSDG